jgi:hypothetical protein
MARYGVKTNKSAQEIIEQAVDFFGENGVGLEITDRGSCCATFEGGGGHVSLTVTEGDKTEVELVTREWDYQVKQFMRQIA